MGVYGRNFVSYIQEEMILPHVLKNHYQTESLELISECVELYKIHIGIDFRVSILESSKTDNHSNKWMIDKVVNGRINAQELSIKCYEEALKFDDSLKLASLKYLNNSIEVTNLCQLAALKHLNEQGKFDSSMIEDILKIDNPCQVVMIKSGEYLPVAVLR